MLTKKTDIEKTIDSAVNKYPAVVEKVKQIKDVCMKLKVNGHDDLANYEIVKAHLKDVAGLRKKIEETRKELNADAIAYKRAVDDKAKEFQALIEPIENHLKDQKAVRDDFLKKEKAAADEKKRIEAEERAKAAEEENARLREELAAARGEQKFPDESFSEIQGQSQTTSVPVPEPEIEVVSSSSPDMDFGSTLSDSERDLRSMNDFRISLVSIVTPELKNEEAHAKMEIIQGELNKVINLLDQAIEQY